MIDALEARMREIATEVFEERSRALADPGRPLRGAKGAADYLGVSASTVYHWVQSGVLVPERPGGVNRLTFSRAYLDAFRQSGDPAYRLRAARRR